LASSRDRLVLQFECQGKGRPRASSEAREARRLADVAEPLLFVAGTEDVQTPGSAPLKPGIDQVVFADDAQRIFDAAGEPKDLLLVDSRFHSSELVTLAEDEVVEETRGAISESLIGSAISPSSVSGWS
jgi:hypothetical protein